MPSGTSAQEAGIGPGPIRVAGITAPEECFQRIDGFVDYDHAGWNLKGFDEFINDAVRRDAASGGYRSHACR
jgi:hypothetical protein